MRLQKILAQATDLSRRAAEQAIKDGLVKVNGVIVTKMGSLADPDHDRVALRNKQVRIFKQKIYIAFNKPRNTIVSKSDPEGRPLIWDRMNPELKEVLNSAGRLDFDSEGLILLTNDGELIFKLTHPSCEIWKTYYVKVTGIPSDEKIEQLRHGVRLEDGVTQPAKVTYLRKTENNACYEMAIREGRNRQIRRMFTKIGHPVSKLRRIAIGSINLGTLKVGEWRYLNKKEVFFVKRLVTQK